VTLWALEASVVSGLASGQNGLWVVGRELLSGVYRDEALVPEPVDGAALSSDVTQRVPR